MKRNSMIVLSIVLGLFCLIGYLAYVYLGEFFSITIVIVFGSVAISVETSGNKKIYRDPVWQVIEFDYMPNSIPYLLRALLSSKPTISSAQKRLRIPNLKMICKNVPLCKVIPAPEEKDNDTKKQAQRSNSKTNSLEAYYKNFLGYELTPYLLCHNSLLAMLTSQFFPVNLDKIYISGIKMRHLHPLDIAKGYSVTLEIAEQEITPTQCNIKVYVRIGTKMLKDQEHKDLSIKESLGRVNAMNSNRNQQHNHEYIIGFISLDFIQTKESQNSDLKSEIRPGHTSSRSQEPGFNRETLTNRFAGLRIGVFVEENMEIKREFKYCGNFFNDINIKWLEYQLKSFFFKICCFCCSQSFYKPLLGKKFAPQLNLLQLKYRKIFSESKVRQFFENKQYPYTVECNLTSPMLDMNSKYNFVAFLERDESLEIHTYLDSKLVCKISTYSRRRQGESLFDN